MAIIKPDLGIASPIICRITIEVNERGKIAMTCCDPSLSPVRPAAFAPVNPLLVATVLTKVAAGILESATQRKTDATKTDSPGNDGDGNNRAG